MGLQHGVIQGRNGVPAQPRQPHIGSGGGGGDLGTPAEEPDTNFHFSGSSLFFGAVGALVA